MPLVEKQVEHLARPNRSPLSHKEKKSLTSKLNADAAIIDWIIDAGKSHSVAIEVFGVTGVAD